MKRGLVVCLYFASSGYCCGTEYDFIPISFKCPDENSGIFEVVKRGPDGAMLKIQSSYKGHRLSRVIYSVAPPQLDFKVMADGSLYEEKDMRKRKLFENILPGFQPIKERVCDDPDKETRVRYFEIVEKNRRSLGYIAEGR